MNFFVNLFYSILLLGSGILVLKYRRNIKGWTGNFYWAEHYLGRGSTYLVIIMLGLLLIFLGILYPFGGIEYLFGNSNNLKVTIKK